MRAEQRMEGGTALPPSAYYVRRVKTKLASGEYQTEPAVCFCGSEERTLIAAKDRYGFDHPMNLCENCGLIYASPRMTEESYRKFYQNEYRLIYDSAATNSEIDFEKGVANGHQLKSYVEHYGLNPKTVFDIGCNSGAWLQPFMDAGAEVLGVDYGPDRVSFGRAMGMPVQVGGLDEIERTGQKADLIIMVHLLEHVLDLEGTLNRVRHLLSDDGMAYVRVPGLFTWDLRLLFQNAHVWQFTAHTLSYVMESSGFEKVSVDEFVSSLWKKADWTRSKKDVWPEYPNEVRAFLKGIKPALRRIPVIKGKNKFPVEYRKNNMKYAFSRKLPNIAKLINAEDGKEAVILGGGPSADGYIDKIRSLQKGGAFIIAIERMYPWCLKHDIVPEYVIAMDSSADVVDAFDLVIPQPRYLLNSTCVPAVFKLLSRAETYIYSTPNFDIDDEFLASVGDKEGVQLNSGASVTLCALSAAMLLGSRDFHVFGFDCHISDGGYAKGIAGAGDLSDQVTVRVGERDFVTTYPYLLFAQQFFQLRQFGQNDGLWNSVRVYGDSLVNAMSTEDLSG